MNNTIQSISLFNLSLALIPLIPVLWALLKWSSDLKDGLYAFVRMVAQLLLVGYLLNFIFNSDSALLVLLILLVMITVSSWISLRSVKALRWSLLGKAGLAIALGGIVTLIVVTRGVLEFEPWYEPRIIIPLAGMIFANAMNSVSLCADRVVSELRRMEDFERARGIAYRTSLIPIINSLLAVGLVSLPGMMTGQILSGVSPLIAVRYQIMVMCMVFTSAGISSACFLILSRTILLNINQSSANVEPSD